MKLRTKLLSLLLAFAMLLALAACSNSADEQTSPDPDVDESPSVSESTDPVADSILPADFEPDPNVEDLCLATADIPGDFTLLTAGGHPISARMYLYWLAFSISELESNLYSYYGMPLDWSEELGLTDLVKADALNAALMYTLVPARTAELGYDLTQEQQDEIDTYTASTIESMGGEEAFQDALRALGLDRDTYLAINCTPYYYDRLVEGLFADRPTDADLDAYIEQADILCAKHILLLTTDMSTREPLSEDVIAQKKAAAEDILKQLQESDDPAADFDALMHQYSEDTGLAANPDGYTFTAGEMVSEFEDGTRALEFGAISGIVESPYGYHIILRLEPDKNALRDDCLSFLASDQISQWISEADVVFSDEYNSLDPQMFYEKFMAYQAMFSALKIAES